MNNYHEPSSQITENDIDKLTRVLSKAWSLETASPKSRPKWSIDNKALGQCTVTALVVNDLFGGDIIYDTENNHMWNLLPDGTEQDFSREQFEGEVNFNHGLAVTRDEILNSEKAEIAETAKRYMVLASKVKELLAVKN